MGYRPQDTIHVHEGLMDWLALHTPAAKQIFSEFVNIDKGLKATATVPVNYGPDEVIDDLGFGLAVAEPWFITTDVAAAIQEASRTMPGFDVHASDFPSHTGFLLFEEPVDFRATDGNPVPVGSLWWQRRSVGRVDLGQDEEPGCVTWEFSPPETYGDYITGYGEEHGYLSHAEAERGRNWRANKNSIMNLLMKETLMVPSMLGSMADGRLPYVPYPLDNPFKPGPPNRYLTADNDPDMTDLFNAWYSGEETNMAKAVHERFVVEEDGTENGRWVVRTPTNNRWLLDIDPTYRFLMTLFIFVKQEIPLIDKIRLRKTQVKSQQRRGMKGAPISVIHWRKREPSRQQIEGASGRTLKHRHVRKGHWRRQWYPSEQRHFPIYIMPTLVGDESLPLLANHKVNAVVR